MKECFPHNVIESLVPCLHFLLLSVKYFKNEGNPKCPRIVLSDTLFQDFVVKGMTKGSEKG